VSLADGNTEIRLTLIPDVNLEQFYQGIAQWLPDEASVLHEDPEFIKPITG